MNIWAFFELFNRLNKRLNKIMSKNKIKIIKLDLKRNPRNPEWGKRDVSLINKIIVHQELGEGTTQQVHNYHISTESHLKPGVGAPAIAYHFSIEKDGTIYKCNSIKDVTWHCVGENIQSIGIMIVGNFAWRENVNGKSPTQEQLKSLRQLLDYLTEKYIILKQNVYGHKDFGKESCPGFVLYDFVNDYKQKEFRIV